MISLRQIGLIPLALALVASCGASSWKSATAPASTPSAQTPPSKSAPSTKAAYIAKVNALCETMNARVTALGTAGSDPVAAADLNDKAIAITTDTLRQIRAVTPPAGEAGNVAAIYTKVDAVLTDARAISTALRAGDQSAAQTAHTKLETDADAADAASSAYGLSVCGS